MLCDTILPRILDVMMHVVLSVKMLAVSMVSVILLCVYADFLCAEFHWAECHSIECCSVKSFWWRPCCRVLLIDSGDSLSGDYPFLSVITLLFVIMLSIVMLMLKIILRLVIMPSVMSFGVFMLKTVVYGVHMLDVTPSLIILSVIMLDVVMLNVMAPKKCYTTLTLPNYLCRNSKILLNHCLLYTSILPVLPIKAIHSTINIIRPSKHPSLFIRSGNYTNLSSIWSS